MPGLIVGCGRHDMQHVCSQKKVSSAGECIFRRGHLNCLSHSKVQNFTHCGAGKLNVVSGLLKILLSVHQSRENHIILRMSIRAEP